MASPSDNPLKRLIHEIHRRSLWQVLGIFLLGGWVAFEVVQTLTEGLGLPEWFPAFAIVLLIVGLPVVLATAFVQEGGPGRDAGDVEVAGAPVDAPSGGASSLFTWRNALGGGVLAFALLGFIGTGWILFGGGIGGGADTGELPQQATIAVLPFQNNSPDAENVYFADGVHEDILTQLSKIGALSVISRTSVMRYRDTPEANLREIGEELGATAILEGSVRRAGNRILVTTQLIDVATDAHLWAETYERELNDIFAVQRDIAERVAEALRATLTPQEATRLARAPTGNLDAYDFYLRGRHAYYGYTEEGNDEAIRLYNVALELDSEYALVWANLSVAYFARPFLYGGDPAWGDSALVVAERALELNPEESAAHIALSYAYGLKGRRQRATEEYLRALELDPNNVRALNSLGLTHMLEGRLDEAITWFEHALRLDPTNIVYRNNLSNVYLIIGDNVRSLSLLQENVDLQDPESVLGLELRARLVRVEGGDPNRVLELMEQRVERDPESADLRFDAARTAFETGNYERVIEHMTEGLGLSPNARAGALIHGLALIQTGREEEGLAALAEVIERRRGQIGEGSEGAIPWIDLAIAYGALGETVEALDAFDQVYELGHLILVGDAMYGTQDATRYVLALSTLQTEPRFQEVWRQMEEDVAEMRRRIEAR